MTRVDEVRIPFLRVQLGWMGAARAKIPKGAERKLVVKEVRRGTPVVPARPLLVVREEWEVDEVRIDSKMVYFWERA
jgi:hypothetical protein